MTYIKHIVFCILALTARTANSSIITEIWSGEVGALSNTSAYSVGDIVSWSIIYDSNKNNQMTIYNDGANGVSDRGNNDDSLNTLFCIDPSINVNCSSSTSPTDGFTEFFDSTSNVSHIYDKMVASLSTSDTLSDQLAVNRDNRIFRDVPWGVSEQIDYWSDDFRYLADNYPFRCSSDCPNTGNAIFTLTYLDSSNEVQFSSVTLTRVSHTTSSSAFAVYEPDSLALLIVGFAGVVFASRREKYAPGHHYSKRPIRDSRLVFFFCPRESVGEGP